mmetsp:Transcript_20636/g.56969  ORF Transcript_20636/g.56969 Transcript_20636/m.56969 type:complete len:87 (+) Transcript_20636:787-1047(+)
MLLVVFRGAKVLALCCGDRGVPLNEPLHHAAYSLNPEREWSDVQEEHVLHIRSASARNDCSLHCSPVGNSFIRVDILAEFFAVEIL